MQYLQCVLSYVPMLLVWTGYHFWWNVLEIQASPKKAFMQRARVVEVIGF